jgi:hypothetical protein
VSPGETTLAANAATKLAVQPAVIVVSFEPILLKNELDRLVVADSVFPLNWEVDRDDGFEEGSTSGAVL